MGKPNKKTWASLYIIYIHKVVRGPRGIISSRPRVLSAPFLLLSLDPNDKNTQVSSNFEAQEFLKQAVDRAALYSGTLFKSGSRGRFAQGSRGNHSHINSLSARK